MDFSNTIQLCKCIGKSVNTVQFSISSFTNKLLYIIKLLSQNKQIQKFAKLNLKTKLMNSKRNADHSLYNTYIFKLKDFDKKHVLMIPSHCYLSVFPYGTVWKESRSSRYIAKVSTTVICRCWILPNGNVRQVWYALLWSLLSKFSFLSFPASPDSFGRINHVRRLIERQEC